MSDLRLITIIPPPPQVQAVQQPQVSGNQAGQSLVANIPVGSVLSGFIINRDTAGNPILRTDTGDITFSSNFFLKIGSEITIRIENTAGSNTAHILSVNGESPEIAVLQSGLANDPEVIVSFSGNKTANHISVSNSENNPTSTQPPIITVKGTIMSPPPNTNASTQPPPLPTGSELTLKINTITPPHTLTQTTQTTPQPIPTQTFTPQAATSNQQPATPSYASYARFVPTPPAASVVPTTDNRQPITSAPTSPPLQTTPAQSGQIITTTVISNDPNGEAILQSPVGIIRLQAGTSLPISSQVTLEITEIKTPETITINPLAPHSATTPIPTTIANLARNSGALSNIFTLLTDANSPESLNFVNNTIPSLSPQSANTTAKTEGHNFIAAIFNFAAAVKNGDLREWLGRANAKWLENNGYEELLKKAESEFSTISRQYNNPPANQWQSLFFPIAVEGELQQVRLFVKRDRKEKQGQNSERIKQEDTRFVLEMDMSQLGQLQMDGFVKRSNQNILFDLVVRSHTALSEQVQKDIMFIYNDMGELTGYKGSLTFQNVKDFPVNPMENIINDDDIGDVIA